MLILLFLTDDEVSAQSGQKFLAKGITASM